MKRKVVVLGGGTGLSTLLKGLKEFPIDITAVVSVCDDGRSTGRLREEFHIPAMGDIRQVLVSLSETEPLFEKLLNYRFKTTSDLDGHSVGNLLLTALANMTGSMSNGIETLSSILNLKGRILPLTEDEVTLMAKMKDGTIVEGEHNITEYPGKIASVYYKDEPTINDEVIKAINEADLIILSMGSVFTSTIPNLLCKEVIEAFDKSKAPIMYTCNFMTQPGETDEFKVSNHVKTINNYLGKRKLDVVLANDGMVDKKIIDKYKSQEQKEEVVLDEKNLKNINIVHNNYVDISSGTLRHDAILLSLDIFKYLITYYK